MPIVYFIAACFLGFIPMKIASEKGYSAVGFYIFGWFLFLPALIVALCLENKRTVSSEDWRSEELQKLRRELEEIKREANKAPKERLNPICPSCGGANADAKFCRACGAQLELIALTEDKSRVCQWCRHVVSESDDFCGECGKKLGDLSGGQPEAVRVTPKDGKVVCPLCDASQMENRTFCWRCSVKFARE